MPSNVQTGLRHRTVQYGRNLEVGGAVLRPRRDLVRKTSVVASLVTQDERRQLRLREERAYSNHSLFLADATVERSRNVVSQLGDSHRAAAFQRGEEPPRILVGGGPVGPPPVPPDSTSPR